MISIETLLFSGFAVCPMLAALDSYLWYSYIFSTR